MARPKNITTSITSSRRRRQGRRRRPLHRPTARPSRSRMKRPRRLGYGEEATLVEHLEELRGRIIIMLCALALTTALAFAFHTHILTWLNHALPADKRQPVTFGVTEPF